MKYLTTLSSAVLRSKGQNVKYSDLSGTFSFLFIITARKRSLEQGNIFTSTSDSFCSQGKGVCLWVQLGCLHLGMGCVCLWVWDWVRTSPWHTLDTLPGYTLPLDTQTLGHTDPPGHTPGHTPPGQPPSQSTSGLYASYWDAFLFNNVFWLKTRKFYFSLSLTGNSLN